MRRASLAAIALRCWPRRRARRRRRRAIGPARRASPKSRSRSARIIAARSSPCSASIRTGAGAATSSWSCAAPTRAPWSCASGACSGFGSMAIRCASAKRLRSSPCSATARCARSPPPQAIWHYQLDPAASAQLASGTPAGSTRRRLSRGAGAAAPRTGSLSGILRARPAGAARRLDHVSGRSLPRRRAPARQCADRAIPRRHVSLPRRPADLFAAHSRSAFRASASSGASTISPRSASWIYGIVTVMLALVAGWVAAFFFRRT